VRDSLDMYQQSSGAIGIMRNDETEKRNTYRFILLHAIIILSVVFRTLRAKNQNRKTSAFFGYG